ncbi:6-pyruvoyl trahydropterin synthase family protein [Anaerosporobacter sp.]
MKQDYVFNGKEVYLTKKFSFSAAHQLNGSNKQLHGHNYTVNVTLKGGLNNDGFLVDLNKLESLIYTHVIYRLDNSFLNNYLKPLNPTVEVLTIYLYHEIETCLRLCEYTTNLKLVEVTVYETDSYSATIRETN